MVFEEGLFMLCVEVVNKRIMSDLHLALWLSLICGGLISLWMQKRKVTKSDIMEA